MGRTRDKLEQALEQAERERANDAEFVRMRDFVEDARRRGILKKQVYDIPLIDTIGRAAYRTERD